MINVARGCSLLARKSRIETCSDFVTRVSEEICLEFEGPEK